jgi:hypothetical protein
MCDEGMRGGVTRGITVFLPSMPPPPPHSQGVGGGGGGECGFSSVGMEGLEGVCKGAGGAAGLTHGGGE